MQFQNLIALVKKEFLLDWKQKSSLAGILIYITSTVFVCYLSFKQIVELTTFNALLWVIILFTSINTVTRSFSLESEGRLLYLYAIANPKEIILGKMTYNAILLFILSLVTYSAYSFLLGNNVVNQVGYVLTLSMGSIGLSIILSVMAAIASKTTNNPTLMAILSFPVILPFFITLIALSLNFAQGLNTAQNFNYFLALGGIIAISITMGYLLFPYLWRD